MATELVTLIWCDLDHAEHVKGSPFTVSIAGPGEQPTSYAVDLCDTCAKSYLDLRAEVVEHGRQVASKSHKRRDAVSADAVPPTPQACPAPGCDFTTTAASGLDGHCRTQHGQTVAELNGSADKPCPVDECERLFDRRQGLIMHLRTAHGWTSEQWQSVG